MNLFKKIISLNYRKEVLPLHVLKDPKKILVLFPLNPYSTSSFIPAIKLLRKKFKSVEIIGITRKEYAEFFEKSNLFDQVMWYESKPVFLSRQFFRLRKKLRDIPALMSIDFNLKSDLLSWIGGATLRAGTQSSPFINYKVKLPNSLSEDQSALKLVKTICTGR